MFIQTTNVLVFMLQCKQYLKIMRNGNVTPFSSSSVFTSFCGGLEYFSGALYVEFPICRYIHSLICAQNSNQYQLDTTKIKTDNAVNTEYSVLRCVFKDFFPPSARPHYSRDITSLTCQNVLRCQIGYSLVSIIQLYIHQSVEGAAAVGI